jgi:GT2 family glycosyltransferase
VGSQPARRWLHVPLTLGGRWWERFFHRAIGYLDGPSSDLSPQGDGKWLATSPTPWMVLTLTNPRNAGHWVVLRTRLLRRGTNCVAKLRFDTGEGFDAQLPVELSATRRGVINEAVYFPPGLVALRWEPVQSPGYFEQTPIEITRINRLERVVRMWVRIIAMRYRRTGPQLAVAGVSLPRALIDLTSAYHAAGRLRSPLSALPYRTWVERFDVLTDADRTAIKRHIERLPRRPLISVIMPTFNTPELFLRRAIESVRSQLYEHWELCIADDASTGAVTREVLDELMLADPRIKVAYRETNGHISAASNTALELAVGEYIALLDHDDVLAEQALYRVAFEINEHPGALIVYSDEDKIDEFGQRFDPYFKPDWNPQLFLGQNLISHLGVYQADAVRAVGGFRTGFEGSQDYDLALRVAERAPHADIRHIPAVLYHWGVISGSTSVSVAEKPYAWDAGRRALTDHLQRRGIEGVVERVGSTAFYRVRYQLEAPGPKVSIIVPTRNAYAFLSRCLHSIGRKTTYTNHEVIVVDNQTDEPRTQRYLKRLERLGNTTVISFPDAFNFSAINNLAADVATGDVLCLVNNDTEVISGDWLEEMLRYLQQDRVGIVGAKLLYPDGAVQHAGVVLHPTNVAAHVHAGISKRESGYFGRAILAQDCTAVTAACLMVWKRIYQQVGGMDEENLPVAFNDVDLCLRVREAGYRVLWTPFAQIYHHESITRGRRDSIAKKLRFSSERAYMRRRWHENLERDPFYNPNLNQEDPDFSLSAAPARQDVWNTSLQRDRVLA